LSAPTFASAPAGNFCPDLEVVVEVRPVNNAASYKLYKSGTTEAVRTVIPENTYDPVSFTIIESGNYTVKAVSASGLEGAPSPTVTVTINDNCPTVSVLNDLAGTWNVVDKKSGNPYGTQNWTYTVTVEESNGSLLIKNFAADTSYRTDPFVSTSGATLTATVDFSQANETRYGVITIAEQGVTAYSEATGLTGVKFLRYYKSGSGYFDPWVYGDGTGAITADIVSVNGKPYFKLNDKFAITSASSPDGDAVWLVRSLADNNEAFASFTRQ
jgi:hypothetical protein